jgi:predicted nucleotidyltransferase
MQTERDHNKDNQDTRIPPATLERIRSITRQIVQQFHPQKVILFGSYAYGQPTEDSDVDLLVVMDTAEPPLHTAAHIAAAVEHPFPLDIVVHTPAEFAAAVQRKGVFATEVATKGVTLYEAGNAGVA